MDGRRLSPALHLLSKRRIRLPERRGTKERKGDLVVYSGAMIKLYRHIYRSLQASTCQISVVTTVDSSLSKLDV